MSSDQKFCIKYGFFHLQYWFYLSTGTVNLFDKTYTFRAFELTTTTGTLIYDRSFKSSYPSKTHSGQFKNCPFNSIQTIFEEISISANTKIFNNYLFTSRNTYIHTTHIHTAHTILLDMLIVAYCPKCDAFVLHYLLVGQTKKWLLNY